MRIELTPMNADQFAVFLADQIPRFARDLAVTDHLMEADALTASEAKIHGTLPDGLKTEGQSFLVAKANDLDVARVWLAIDVNTRESYLYQLTVFDHLRGQGYGRACMRAIEEFAREHGGRILWLNVFAHNVAARCLYAKSGFAEATVHMKKPL